MSNHTPGPWTVDPEGEHAVEVEGATGVVVCTVYQPANNAPDARLIAAAPELYAALANLYDNGLIVGAGDHIDEVRFALNLADTGRDG